MSDQHRKLRAFAIAPLSGPIAVFIGVFARAVVTHAVAGNASSNSVASILFLLWLLLLFGAPVAYGGTFIVLWPVTVMLRREDLLPRWWALMGVGALGGAVLLPLYERVLLPRGTLDLFPGDGLVGGAAIGLVLWLLGYRGHRARSE